MNEGWTDGQIKSLKEMAARGETAQKIADAIGKSRCAVLGKTFRLNLSLRKNQMPVRKKPVRAKKAVTAEPIGPVISLIDLRAGDCRWPKGHPGEPGFGFCGAGVVTGSPYCAHHKEKAKREMRKSAEEIAGAA